MKRIEESRFDAVSSEVHDLRLTTVVDRLLESGARRVVDLGCGGGVLLVRLAWHAEFERIVGIDSDQQALAAARSALEFLPLERQAVVQLHHGSFISPELLPEDCDAATLVETIEHVDPRDLSRLEQGLFRRLRPRTVLVSTPNQDYNSLLGLAADEFRHADHRFEWSRARFHRWATGVAQRHGYAVKVIGIGRHDPVCGSCTQMADFRREPADESPYRRTSITPMARRRSV